MKGKKTSRVKAPRGSGKGKDKGGIRSLTGKSLPIKRLPSGKRTTNGPHTVERPGVSSTVLALCPAETDTLGSKDKLIADLEANQPTTPSVSDIVTEPNRPSTCKEISRLPRNSK